MLTKTNICSVQNYLRHNTGRQQFENEKQNIDVAPLEKALRTPVNDGAFSLSLFVTFVLSLITNCLFVSFHSLNFGCKISRINPLLVLISSKLPAITNIIHKLL